MSSSISAKEKNSENHDNHFGMGENIAYMCMYHFSYSCKTERENGISRLISALCVNCKFTSECNSGIFQKYSRIIDYSMICMCIWCGLLQKLEKSKIWPFCFHLVKYLLSCKDTSHTILEYSRKISECWVLKNLDVHLEQTTSELEFKSEKSKIGIFCLEFNGQVLVRQG